MKVTPRQRLIAVLASTRGSIVEAVLGTLLVVVVTGIMVSGGVAVMNALTANTSNAERAQAIVTLLAKPESVPGWVPGAKLTQTVTLPSTSELPVTLWATQNSAKSGTTYYASIPRSGNINQHEACADTDAVTRACIYQSRFAANDVRTLLPPPVDGLVTPGLNTTTVAGGLLASAPAADAATWRFYLDVDVTGASGTIRVTQDDVILSTIPVAAGPGEYFGTLTVPAGANVTIRSSDRAVTLNNFLMYKAGS